MAICPGKVSLLPKVMSGAYILENTLPPWGKEKISADVIWRKNRKRQRGKCKRKRKKGERKRKKGERK